MSSETPAEQAEKSTVLKHVANAAFPEVHLAPWMGLMDRRGAAVVVALRTTADISEELDRRVWLDAHPEESNTPEEKELILRLDLLREQRDRLEKELAAAKKADPKKEEQLEDLEGKIQEAKDRIEGIERLEFQLDRVRGAAGMLGYCMRALAENTHDYAPSIGGIGRRQALSLGMAQKSGVAVEPKERSRWEKLTGGGKDREKISGGV